MRIYAVSGRFARFTLRRKIYCVFTALRTHGAESMHFSRVIWHAGFHAYFTRFGSRPFFRRADLSGFRHFSHILSGLKATFDAYLRDFQQFIAFWGHAKNRLWIDKIMILPAFFRAFSRFARVREFLESRFDAYYAGSVRVWVIWKDTGRQF